MKKLIRNSHHYSYHYSISNRLIEILLSLLIILVILKLGIDGYLFSVISIIAWIGIVYIALIKTDSREN